MCTYHHRQTQHWYAHLQNGTSLVSTELRTPFISHIKVRAVPNRFCTWKMIRL
jgi:hypothetical protein